MKLLRVRATLWLRCCTTAQTIMTFYQIIPTPPSHTHTHTHHTHTHAGASQVPRWVDPSDPSIGGHESGNNPISVTGRRQRCERRQPWNLLASPQDGGPALTAARSSSTS